MTTHFSSKAHLWKQRGTIFFWRYLENVRNYPDWHLSLDAEAHESLTALFHAFVEEGLKCKRTLVVTRPAGVVLRVPNNRNGEARFYAPVHIRLSFNPAPETGWLIDEVDGTIEWQLGPEGAVEVLEVLDEPGRYFDETFGGDPPIWWWGIAQSAG